MEHVYGILLEHVYGILLDEKFLYRSVHAAFVNTKWYEAWLERTLLLDPIIFDMWSPGVLSWAPGQPYNSHHARHKTHRHLLFRVCVVVLSSVTSRSVAAAAASSLMRSSPSPSCRGDAANPWLESAFVSHVGCVSHHRFVCFPQSLVIACVVSFLCISAESLQCLCISAESRHCFVFLRGFNGVSSLLVYFRRSLVIALYFRRVSSLLCISAESRHCFVLLLLVSVVSRIKMNLHCFWF